MTLQDYIIRLQRLLHDTNNSYYTQQELIDYINEARGTIAYQTGCLRQSYIEQIPAGTGSLPYPPTMLDVWKIYLTLQGTWTYPVQYVPYSEYRKLAYNPTLIGRPYIFTTQPGVIYLYPNTDQEYSIEIYGTFAPSNLMNLTDEDTILYPFTDLVPYYAAYLANLYAQRIDKAGAFLQMYKDRATQVAPSIQRIKNA